MVSVLLLWLLAAVLPSDQAGDLEGFLQVEEVVLDFPGVPHEKVLQGEGVSTTPL